MNYGDWVWLLSLLSWGAALITLSVKSGAVNAFLEVQLEKRRWRNNAEIKEQDRKRELISNWRLMVGILRRGLQPIDVEVMALRDELLAYAYREELEKLGKTISQDGVIANEYIMCLSLLINRLEKEWGIKH